MPGAPGDVPGILGAVDESLSLAAIAALVRAMAARLHVQPGLKVEIDPSPVVPAVLGRVDLGIFDPAPAPAVSPDGACRLVLHGEVRGMRGASKLLTAYLERGEAALAGRSGSFAAALWDGRARRLYLANDRFGLRNVYYVATTTRLVFAPLVGSLLADSRVARRLDPQAAAEFALFQCVLLDHTLIDDVRLLPPASLLVFEPGRGVRLRTTWSVRYRPRPASDREHAHVLPPRSARRRPARRRTTSASRCRSPAGSTPARCSPPFHASAARSSRSPTDGRARTTSAWRRSWPRERRPGTTASRCPRATSRPRRGPWWSAPTVCTRASTRTPRSCGTRPRSPT